MANKKFSELTEVTTPNSASIFATAYDGDNFKVTLTNIAANMPSITTTGTVTGTTFIGNVTGNVTGSVTGNADTATALATGRSIGMTGDVTWTSASFDGTGNVTGTAAIGSGVIINADVNASAAIDASKIHDGTVSNTEFGYLNGVSSAIQTQIDTKITASSSDTLTNKTFDANGTGNSLSNVEVADLASGVLDTDISSVSASDDTLASAKAIKTYVDSQVTAQDLDFQADTGGALSIDLDSETLTFTGGTGIDTSGLGNAVTFAIDSTVATLSGTQTLTNKSGNISQWTNDSAYLTGNQTITLSGDASGSGTTAITVTVADDSHNHIISNVDGLQTALDAKLANVVEDTTPQLGGNLDLNSSNITGTGNIDTTGTLSLTNTTTGDSLAITTTEDSSIAAPVISLKRNSASPADGDYLGQIKFKGENDADQEVVYAKITGKTSDVTDTTEDGLIEFALKKAGSNNIGARLTSTDFKLINGTGLEVGGYSFPTSDGSADQFLKTNGAGTLSFTSITQATGNELEHVVEDTTPQLGGDLDTQTNTIDLSANTASLKLNKGTTAQRDGSPSSGMFRFNTTTTSFEGYDGSAWGDIGGGGGASAGGAIYENADDITSDYTITSGKNGFSVGPMTIASGVTVTVPSGQRWVIL
jgi:hypothetical protein